MVSVSNMVGAEALGHGDVIGRHLSNDEIKILPHVTRIRYKAFYDDRLNSDLSFDRLGTSGGIENRILANCATAACANYKKRALNFIGWGGITMRILNQNNFSVVMRPQSTEEHKNPHHCELSRDNFRTKAQAKALAYQLLAHCEESLRFIPWPPR